MGRGILTWSTTNPDHHPLPPCRLDVTSGVRDFHTHTTRHRKCPDATPRHPPCRSYIWKQPSFLKRHRPFSSSYVAFNLHSFLNIAQAVMFARVRAYFGLLSRRPKYSLFRPPTTLSRCGFSSARSPCVSCFYPPCTIIVLYYRKR